ncbi:RlpA-like double-psi beta-barrel-protein domain-containing protein-containing protein [Parachaetomium inaequale]|uniref:RlpA-like double-psi beta-barrel-protein domain-containing protein-containing protein n=1 Tax=Parachaetomium inaequale TaxID=2588326 RepID=A0AAN6PD00_9PEZI|nr:RlpA-like double-psi beta-barrel-protein domain-containing protein-containing protein [Parachaetomium inaequale]
MFASTITSVLAITATLLGAVAATPISATGAIEAAGADKRAALTSGKFTYYNAGLGACGQTHSDADLVVAMSHVDFDPSSPNGSPNNNPLCGRRIRAAIGGKTVDVTVVDRCEACNSGDLDLSPTAFGVLSALSVGVIQGTWEWI